MATNTDHDGAFVLKEFSDRVDFSTLEPVPAELLGHALRKRHADIIWKVRVEEQEVYLYFLLEFQSSTHQSMVQRVLTSVMLLYQSLTRNKVVSPNFLPPIVPVVITGTLMSGILPPQQTIEQMNKLLGKGYDDLVNSYLQQVQ